MITASTLIKWVAAWSLAVAALTQALAADGVAEAIPGVWNYQIAPGDTLLRISADMLDRPDDWPKLQKLNRIANPTRLTPGGTIRIPLDLLKKSAMVATVIFVRGRVMLGVAATDSTTRPERALIVGDEIRSRDVISTDSDSSLSLRFVDGSRLMIGPASQVSVIRMLEIGRSALPDALLNIERGDAEIHIVPKTGRRFELRTPAMNLGVRGTSFRARVDASGKSAGVEVLEGRVGASAGRSQVPVNAGFGTLAEAGKAIPPPRPLLAPPVLAGVSRLVAYLPLRFSWPSVPRAVAYRVQILANADKHHLLLDGRFPNASAQWPDLPDGSYTLRVRGIDAAGLEGLDAVQPFAVKARPLAPLAVSPLPDATSIGAATRFEWTGVDDAKRYRLQIARDAAFTDLVFDTTAISQTSVTVDLPPGRYKWRLASIAMDQEGRDDAGPFGPAQSFEQREALPPLQIAEPQIGPEGVRLRWERLAPGRSARLQIANDPEFRQIVLDRTTSGSEFLAELGPGRYHVRARLISADGLAGDYGSARQFDVPLPPISPWWVLPLGWLLLL